jgi:hypothetical protein
MIVRHFDPDKEQADRLVAEMIMEYLMRYPSADSASYGLSFFAKVLKSNP